MAAAVKKPGCRSCLIDELSLETICVLLQDAPHHKVAGLPLQRGQQTPTADTEVMDTSTDGSIFVLPAAAAAGGGASGSGMQTSDASFEERRLGDISAAGGGGGGCPGNHGSAAAASPAANSSLQGELRNAAATGATTAALTAGGAATLASDAARPRAASGAAASGDAAASGVPDTFRRGGPVLTAAEAAHYMTAAERTAQAGDMLDVSSSKIGLKTGNSAVVPPATAADQHRCEAAEGHSLLKITANSGWS